MRRPKWRLEVEWYFMGRWYWGTAAGLVEAGGSKAALQVIQEDGTVAYVAPYWCTVTKAEPVFTNTF